MGEAGTLNIYIFFLNMESINSTIIEARKKIQQALSTTFTYPVNEATMPLSPLLFVTESTDALIQKLSDNVRIMERRINFMEKAVEMHKKRKSHGN